MADCPVCLSPLDTHALVPSCGHACCRTCLLQIIAGNPRGPLAATCPTCRADVSLDSVVCAGELGEAALGQHFVPRRPPVTQPGSADSPGGSDKGAAGEDAAATATTWLGLHSFLSRLEPLDIESQHQAKTPPTSSPGIFRALQLLQCCCPPTNRLLLSAVAGWRIRRQLDPQLPGLRRSAALAACALVAWAGFLACGCLVLQWILLRCGALLCAAVSAASTALLGSPTDCFVLSQPAWALLLMWATAGALAVQEAHRRGARVLPCVLTPGTSLLRAMGAWSLVTLGLCAAVLALRLAIDVLSLLALDFLGSGAWVAPGGSVRQSNADAREWFQAAGGYV